MKPTHIILTDQGIGCIEAPEKLEYLDKYGNPHEEDYNKALEEAIKQLVLFKDQAKVKQLLLKAIRSDFRKLTISRGELYHVPDGYEIKINKRVHCDEYHQHTKDSCFIKEAILVPKQEPETCPKCRTTDFAVCHSMHCPMRKEEPVKQPTSIEEAAKKYALSLVDDYEGTPQYICFIAGAKSRDAEIEELNATIKRRCDKIAMQDKEIVVLMKRVEELEQFKQEKK